MKVKVTPMQMHPLMMWEITTIYFGTADNGGNQHVVKPDEESRADHAYKPRELHDDLGT